MKARHGWSAVASLIIIHSVLSSVLSDSNKTADRINILGAVAAPSFLRFVSIPILFRAFIWAGLFYSASVIPKTTHFSDNVIECWGLAGTSFISFGDTGIRLSGTSVHCFSMKARKTNGQHRFHPTFEMDEPQWKSPIENIQNSSMSQWNNVQSIYIAYCKCPYIICIIQANFSLSE